ncbi:MAG: right-handed parallel beta-helix repeat-containing protein, partial [Acidimicrobiia bacterium]
AAGTTIRWVNDGDNVHNVTPNAGHSFGSGALAPGKSYVHKFADPGSYAYYCTLHGTPTKGQHAVVAVGDAATPSPVAPVAPVGGGDRDAPAIHASGRTIRVPGDSSTIQAGVDRARPGDLVLVSPGVYRESVTVGTDGVVIRGVDRNTTILDGQFRRENGVFVAGANGVAVENLIARNYTENGFFWNGVLGYRGSYLTAYRNGDYGIYAYDSQYGQFDHSYASGSPDSGFYIGQCNPCHAVITDVVAEYNQLGYSGTNSSGDLFLVNSIWRLNRTGIVPNSLDSEELPPQGHATIAGNVVSENGNPGAARTGTEVFDAALGGGIVVVGGVGDLITRNRIVANTKIGIALAPNPFLQKTYFPASDNTVSDNVVQGSGLVDLAVIPFVADDRNCFSGNSFATSAPTGLDQLKPCGGAPGSGDPTAGALDLGKFLDTSANPPGTNYRETPVAPKQRNMAKAKSVRARPAGAPRKVDLAAIKVPAARG